MVQSILAFVFFFIVSIVLSDPSVALSFVSVCCSYKIKGEWDAKAGVQ